MTFTIKWNNFRNILGTLKNIYVTECAGTKKYATSNFEVRNGCWESVSFQIKEY